MDSAIKDAVPLNGSTIDAFRAGYLQFTVAEAALILDIDPTAFESPDGIQREYLRGRLVAQSEVRKSMIELAANGDPQAQKLFYDIARRSEPEFEEGE